MTHCDYLAAPERRVLAIGWLEHGHDFTRAPVHAADVRCLEAISLAPWQPFSAAGWHDCSLCDRQPGDGPLYYEIEGQPRLIGVANLFVPAIDVMYVAPSLVLHYIADHGYRPPTPFLEAVRAIRAGSAGYVAECERLWAIKAGGTTAGG